MSEAKYPLGGRRARHVLDSIEDPYNLDFQPRALGFAHVNVEPGKSVPLDIALTIDLMDPDSTEVHDVLMGHMPNDPLTGQPLPNGLLLPVSDTGGSGFFWSQINGDFNQPDFDGVLQAYFPRQNLPAFAPEPLGLGLNLLYMHVGLAARASYLGADPPGISTNIIRCPDSPDGAPLDMDEPNGWLALPVGLAPSPPDPTPPTICPDPDEPPEVPGACIRISDDDEVPDTYFPLDRVGGTLEARRFAWEPVTHPYRADLYILRIGYLVAPPGSQKGYSIGGPDSFRLWELVVDADQTEIILPVLPEGAPGPDLVNPAPSDDPNKYMQFGAHTLEVEFNAYLMGDCTQGFRFNEGFMYEDLNLDSRSVSQDSYPFEVPEKFQLRKMK